MGDAIGLVVEFGVGQRHVAKTDGNCSRGAGYLCLKQLLKALGGIKGVRRLIPCHQQLLSFGGAQEWQRQHRLLPIGNDPREQGVKMIGKALGRGWGKEIAAVFKIDEQFTVMFDNIDTQIVIDKAGGAGA